MKTKMFAVLSGVLTLLALAGAKPESALAFPVTDAVFSSVSGDWIDTAVIVDAEESHIIDAATGAAGIEFDTSGTEPSLNTCQVSVWTQTGEITRAVSAASKRGIFDLRAYPKTSPVINTAVTSARCNVPIFTRPDYQYMQYGISNWPVQPQELRLKEIPFLTDGGAISDAETSIETSDGLCTDASYTSVPDGRLDGVPFNGMPPAIPEAEVSDDFIS